MGVSAVQYVLLGINLGSTEYTKKMVEDKSNPLSEFYTDDYGSPDIDWDKLDEYLPKTGLELLFDGMGGEYAIVGKVLAKSTESRWDDCSFVGVTVIDDLDSLIQETKELFAQVPWLKDKAEDIKLHIFAYYH